MSAEQFLTARKNMINSQLLPNKVTDARVLVAFEKVPRENFVPNSLKGIAYIDEDISIGKGQYLREPVILSRLIQAAEIKESDIVLDIGCGTGYSCAIFSHLAATVIGIEEDAATAKQAEDILKEMDLCNIAIINGSIRDGYKEQAPFDVIFINGAIPHIPSHITDQLAEGGRLITVIADNKNSNNGTAVLLTKQKSNIEIINLFDAATPILHGFEEKEFFTF